MKSYSMTIQMTAIDEQHFPVYYTVEDGSNF